MLGKYIKINNETVPNPTKFAFSYEVTESEQKSEAGTDLVIVTRTNQCIIGLSFNLSSAWADKIQNWCAANSVVLTFNGTNITGRLRGFSKELVEHSEYTAGTNGLWRVDCEFREI